MQAVTEVRKLDWLITLTTLCLALVVLDFGYTTEMINDKIASVLCLVLVSGLAIDVPGFQ